MESDQNHENPSLLLLPPPPHVTDLAALRSAYEPPIRAAIAKLKAERDHTDRGTVLFVGIVSPILSPVGSSARQKSLPWPTLQSILARVYSIVALTCAQLSVPSEMHAGPASIDVRVLFIHSHPSYLPLQSWRPDIDGNNTVVVDLPTFASAYHPWRQIFHVDSEPGRRTFSIYISMYKQVQRLQESQLIVVESGLSLSTHSLQDTQSQTYRVVCLGGTFDHLHAGHKLLLTAAAMLLEVPEGPPSAPARFIIGVTGDELLKRKKYAEFVQPWDQRVENVIEFLASLLQLSRSGWADSDINKEEDKVVTKFRNGAIEVHCVLLQDAFGPTTAQEDMDVLVVSGETRSGGDAVNTRRRELGWHDLVIFEVDVLDAEGPVDGANQTKQDFATKISSTAIRERKAEARKQ